MTTIESDITVERPPAMSTVSQMSSPDLPYVEAHDRRILIVDDEESVRNLFADYLDESYSCVTAADAYEALERLSHEPFALVLSDMQMPGLGGIALLRNARRYKEALENQNAELARRGTELERLQAQIVHAEKMASLGQLAAGVAHELNNPAGFIYSNIALLKDDVKRLERCLTAFDEVELPPASAERIREMNTEIG